MPGHTATDDHKTLTLGLSLGALGVVFGDIGTSPLYTIRECFHGHHAIGLSEANILGVVSLIFWSLSVVISLKYVIFILRADNQGEGGIFALLALLPKPGAAVGAPGAAQGGRHMSPKIRSYIVLAALFGAALLYGDGIITPAISVLSAVEGLSVATTATEPLILPLTCGILLGLFLIQRRGTGSIGKLFGPIMLVWFTTIALLGLRAIIEQPRILLALDPRNAVAFFAANGLHGLIVLGSVVLCITGGEALYADLGHFGQKPIRLAWMAVVFPMLLCNYFGQGALLLGPDSAEASFHPFYGLTPKALLYPMVALSTIATIIASQALISGAYSLTQQAIQLGFCPRMRIVHTSSATRGQIYMPDVNHALMLGTIGLVLAFKDSSGLAGAYGIAVTATMGITSIIYFCVATWRWDWPLWKSLPLVGLFCCFDFTYLGANLLKVLDGGWITLAVAVGISILMGTWKRGRAELAARREGASAPISLFIEDVQSTNPPRVSGAAVFMSISEHGIPTTLLHHYKHNKMLHDTVILLTIKSTQTPTVPDEDRVSIDDLGERFYRVIAWYGFMETPNVPKILRLAGEHGLITTMDTTTFFLGKESILATGPSGMMSWRKKLFAYMSQNASQPTNFFSIPPSRVIQLGAMVEL